MSMDLAWLLRLGAAVVVCAIAMGCGDDGGGGGDGAGGGAGSDDDGSGTTTTTTTTTATGGGGTETFSCHLTSAGSDYATCLEYKGSASYIATIREGTNCAGQGGVEGTGCSPAGAATCALGQNGMTGMTTYYYGLTEDDIASYQMICEQQGGTFTPPG